MIKYLVLFLTYLVFVLTSCLNEDEIVINYTADIIDYQLVEQDAQVIINEKAKSIFLIFPSDVLSADDFIANFKISDGATASIDTITQVSGVSNNNYEIPFKYTITSQDSFAINEWYVGSTNNNYTISFGLGGFQKIALSNNKDYGWYINQANTGKYAENNCGPTATCMVAKWSDPNFSLSPVQARKLYKPNGAWWSTSNIVSFLTDFNIPHRTIVLSEKEIITQEKLTKQIDDNKIIILCLDMYFIRKEFNKSMHVDKFYNTNTSGWGHFIVVKGYKKVDGLVFFEVYDPNGYNNAYIDGTRKGKDRYYRSEDIFDATSMWWNYAIIIAEKDGKFKHGEFVDCSKINHMLGR